MSAGYTTFNTDTTAIAARVAALEAIQFTPFDFTFSSAQILSFNTTPVQFLPSPGVGFTYRFADFIAHMITSGPAYATNVNFMIIFAGATQAVSSTTTILTATSNRMGTLTKNTVSSVQYLGNAAVNATVGVGNPTTGTGDLKLYGAYQIVTL